jgi:hypothetical protein
MSAPTAEDGTAGFQHKHTGSKRAQILTAVLTGALSPALNFGDNTHWRYICISHEQKAVHLIDPMGPSHFTPEVRALLEGRLQADATACQIRMCEHILQPPYHNEYMFGPLAIRTCQE